MNVWIVNHYAHPPFQAGSSRHHGFAKHLVSAGHQATIVAASFDHFSRVAMDVPVGTIRSEHLDGVRWVWCGTPSYRSNDAARVRNMVAFARRLTKRKLPASLGQPDVIVGSTPHHFAAAAALRLARAHRVPFVLEVRDLWPETLVQLGNISVRHPLIRRLAMLERKLYSRADHIITLLPRSSAYISQKGGTPERISWLPNGVDLQAKPDTGGSREDRRFTVMYAGAMGLSNNLDSLIDSAAILQSREDIYFRLVGEGPHKRSLQARAREKSIGNVTFEEPVSKDEIFAVLAGADAFVLLLADSPLYEWGMSVNKLFDYMASARPVIIATTASYNPVDESGCGITVADPSPKALAAAIVELAESSTADREAMGERGRRFIEEHHDLRELAQEFEQVLLQAVNRAAPNPR